MHSTARVQITFVGGNERQARYSRGLTATLAKEGIDVLFVHPCWSRNWNKSLAEVSRHMTRCDAIVLSTDVPTLLGEAVRDLARTFEVAWRSDRVRGRAGILAAIRAVAALPEVEALARQRSMADTADGGHDGR